MANQNDTDKARVFADADNNGAGARLLQPAFNHTDERFLSLVVCAGHSDRLRAMQIRHTEGVEKGLELNQLELGRIWAQEQE